MLKYRCLVLDHDDTVVQTERHIGFPYFKEFIEKIRPGQTVCFDDYVRQCNSMVFADMCRKCWNMTDEEAELEYSGWKEYYSTHPHPMFPGIDAVIRRQKAEGGLVCVVSLSRRSDILHDYKTLFGIEPDAIYDYDQPAHLRKPNPFPLEDIMARFSLKPEDLFIVDDLKLGWMMANTAGVKIGYAAWSKLDFPDLTTEMRKICHQSFDSPADLEKYLFE